MSIIFGILTWLLGVGVQTHPTPAPVSIVVHTAPLRHTPAVRPAASILVRTENDAKCPKIEVRMVTDPATDGSTVIVPNCYETYDGSQVEACITYLPGGHWKTVALLNPTGPECSDQYGQGYSDSVMPNAITG